MLYQSLLEGNNIGFEIVEQKKTDKDIGSMFIVKELLIKLCSGYILFQDLRKVNSFYLLCLRLIDMKYLSGDGRCYLVRFFLRTVIAVVKILFCYIDTVILKQVYIFSQHTLLRCNLLCFLQEKVLL